MIVTGKVRTPHSGSNSIQFALKDKSFIPHNDNDKKEVLIQTPIGGYFITIRHKNTNSYMWSSPSCHPQNEADQPQYTKLMELFTNLGFNNKDPIRFNFDLQSSTGRIVIGNTLTPLFDSDSEIEKTEIDKSCNSPLNQILFGPPGTGKTYHTVEAAVKAALPTYDSQNRGDWKQQFDNLSEAGRIRFVTFHQSYGYEEFVQGLRAETRDGQIHYEVRSGIFKQTCEDAASDPDNNYVLVIDEINRGNISKIFGELITLIEDSKRKDVTNTDELSESLSVRLPYSTPDETDFFVPSNLFVIGTMNTADRSLAAMDTALRRRFHFTEMMPDPSVFTTEGVNVKDVDLVQMLTVMNRRIEFLYDREHTLGHAFFMSIKNSDEPFSELKSIFKNKIIPLLEEYFFEDWEKIQLVLGDNQKPSKYQFITEEKAFDAKSLFGGKYANELNVEPQKHFKLNESALGSIDAYVGIYKAQYSGDETDTSSANDSADGA